MRCRTCSHIGYDNIHISVTHNTTYTHTHTYIYAYTYYIFAAPASRRGEGVGRRRRRFCFSVHGTIALVVQRTCVCKTSNNMLYTRKIKKSLRVYWNIILLYIAHIRLFILWSSCLWNVQAVCVYACECLFVCVYKVGTYNMYVILCVCVCTMEG